MRTRLPSIRNMGGTYRVWAFNGALVAGATWLLMSIRHLPAFDSSVRLPWWAFAIAFYLTETYVVHIQFRKDAESFSLSEIPLVMGFFFAAPVGLVAGQALGAALALAHRRRQPPVKLVFNVAHLSIEAAIGTMVFRAIAASLAHIRASEDLAALAAASCASLIGMFAVIAVISLAEGEWQLRMLPRVLTMGSIVALANTSLAIIAVGMLHTAPITTVFLCIPAAMLLFAYRAYTHKRQQHESLEFLYESSRIVQGAPGEEDAMLALLAQARKMFRADVAWITMFPSEGQHFGTKTMLGPGDHTSVMQPVTLDPTEGVWARIASEGQAILLSRPIRTDRLRKHFESLGLRDAMVAPLMSGTTVIGKVAVGNRLGDVSTFREDELKLFETLANHASVSLENARLVSRLQEALAHQTELNRMKDEFVATVSHELRTPLTSIQGYVKTMLRPDLHLDPEETRSYLRIVDRQSERLRGQIEDLLIVSKIESHRMRAVPTAVSVATLSRQVAEDFFDRPRGQTLNLRLEEPLPVLETDEEMLHRILSNLLENAMKYSPEGTGITIGARADGSGVTFSVEDHGRGIAPEHITHIFDRFYQVDQSTTRSAGGAGLGLYICRRLAEALGGRIWVENSAPGLGSTFSVWVPTMPPAGPVDLAEPKTSSEIFHPSAAR